jgi:hypothetical protein
MPALKNIKHETFAQELVKARAENRTQGTAYSRSGYSSTGPGAEVSASRLLADRKNGVADRVHELLSRGAVRAERRVETTVDSLIDKLEINILRADKAGQHSAVNGAVALMSQLRGLLINRTEVASAGGFDGLTSVEAIVSKVRDTEGDEAADWFALMTETDKHRQLAMLDEIRARITDELASQALPIPNRRGLNSRQTLDLQGK